MDKIKLNNVELPYKIVKKDNKNTYFYFKKEGYVQINLSRHQTPNQAIEYMKRNPVFFAEKFENSIQKTLDENKYYLFGNEIQLIYYDDSSLHLDIQNQSLYIPNTIGDQYKNYLLKIERNIMLKHLRKLQQKYLHNPYVDISKITLKTRYTTTRHGSCNYRTKSININLNLLHIDPIYVEYVFLHEISHLKHPNHSQTYYDLLLQLCPKYKEIRKKLKQIKW